MPSLRFFSLPGRSARSRTRTDATNKQGLSVSTRNPSFGKETPTAVDIEPVILVCGNGDGMRLVNKTLAKKPYNLKLTDNPSACTHVVLVMSKGVFQHNPTIQVLEQTMTANKQFMVLVETNEAHGGASIEQFLQELPGNYSTLQECEWVPLERGQQMLHASIRTILRQCNLGPYHQQLDRVFAFYFAHQQVKAQGNMMALCGLFNEMGLKVWLDTQANDPSMQGKMNGVSNSENFLLLCTDGYFTQPNCLMELDRAILEKKPIVVLYEERELYGGAPLGKLIAQVPDKYAFLTRKHDDGSMKHGWIRLEVRDAFQRQMATQVLKHCDIPLPNERVLDAFDRVPDSVSVIAQNQGWFLPGTRKWMFDAVDQWRVDDGADSHVFGILGQAGVGKSVFTAQLALVNKHVVARHFFKHDDRDLADPRNCLWALAKQLRDNVPGFRKAFDEGMQEARSVGEWDLVECFSRLIAKPAQATPDPGHGGRLFVVVDALDECSDSHAMARLLKDDWRSKVPQWLSLLFTTRPSVIAFPETEADAKAQGVAVLNTENASNMADVRRFLEDRVFTVDRVADERLAAKFVEAIATKSEGLFLYLRFLDEVIGNILVHGRRTQLQEEDLQAFPYGLGGIYNDYFGRLHSKLGSEDYMKLLGSVLSAREPLAKELWMRAFGVEGDELDDQAGHTAAVANVLKDEAEKVGLTSFIELQQQCQNLLHVPHSVGHPLSNGVRFVHKSMVDYLTGGRLAKEETALKNPNFKHLHINPSMRKAVLAAPCLNAFTSLEVSDAAKEYASRHAFFHLCEAGRFDQAAPLLFNVRHLLQRLKHDSPNRMATDSTQGMAGCDDEAIQSSAQVVANVLRLGSAGLSQDARELAGQVVGRLSCADVVDLPLVQQLWDQSWNFRDDNGVPWLRPCQPLLASALPSALLRVINGHSDVVSSVRFSPDGLTIISASSDKTIRLWDAATGKEKLDGRPRLEHNSGVNTVAISPDGQTIVSGSKKLGANCNTIHLVDVETGKPQLCGTAVTEHRQDVGSVTFSPDGRTFATGSSDEVVRLWDAETGEVKLIGKSPKPRLPHKFVATQSREPYIVVYSVAYSPDGRTIAAGCSDRAIRLWDVETGEAKLGGKLLREHTHVVYSLAFSPDGRTIVSGSLDATVRLWNPDTGEAKLDGMALEGHTSGVYSVAFSPDSRTVVSGSEDNTIRLWDAETGAMKLGGRAFEGHTSDVCSVAFSPDGSTIVSGSRDRTIRLWDARASDTRLAARRVERVVVDGVVVALAVSPDGRTVLSASTDFVIRSWDVETMELKWSRKLPKSKHPKCDLFVVAFSPDSRTLATGSWDTAIRLFDTETGEARLGGRALEGHSAEVKSVAFSPDGRTIVSGSVGRCIRLWDAETGEAKLGGHAIKGGDNSGIQTVTFSPDGLTIASGSMDNHVRFWDAETGEARLGGGSLDRVHTLAASNPAQTVAFSPDGRTLVSVCVSGAVHLWDVETGEVKLGGQAMKANSPVWKSVAFSRDGQTVIVRSKDNTTWLWDTKTGKTKVESATEQSYSDVYIMSKDRRLVSALDSGGNSNLLIPLTLEDGCDNLVSWSTSTGKVLACHSRIGQLCFMELVR